MFYFLGITISLFNFNAPSLFFNFSFRGSIDRQLIDIKCSSEEKKSKLSLHVILPEPINNHLMYF